MADVALAALQILGISSAGVILQNLIFKKLSDQAALRELKKQLETSQARMKAAQKEKNLPEMEKHLKKVNDLSMRRLSLTMRPNLISSGVLILMLWWMQKTYLTVVIPTPLPLPVLHWKFPLIFLESTLSWFWWYFYVSILVSIIVRRVLKIEL